MSVYDDAGLELADIFDQQRALTLAPADAGPLIAAQLQAVMPDSQLQFAKVEQVLGRITGLFFVDGPPDSTLGKPGASAVDLTNHLFYGPKDAVTGWPAGVEWVGATGPAGTITGATASYVAPEAAPTVTLGGTPTARTFAFGLPDYAPALAGKVSTTRQVLTAGLATGGGSLAADRTITVPKASGAEAVTGTDDTKAVTPLALKSARDADAATTAAAITSAVNALVAAAPGALDTLDELAAALGDDANFAATVTTALAGKVSTARTVTGGGLATGGGALSADRVITVTEATQAEAEAWDASGVVMTPRRAGQSTAAALGLYARADGYGLTDIPARNGFVTGGLELVFNAGYFRKGLAIAASVLALSGATFTRASTGTAVTSAGAVVSFASGVPRVTDKGLLVEEARTNLLLRSQEFDNASWTKDGCTITADAGVAPDGTNTADLITGVSGNRRPYQTATTVNGTAYTMSIFAKAGTSATLTPTFINVAGPGPVFTFATGTWSTVGGWTTSVEALANGWYRIAATYTATATTSGPAWAVDGTTTAYVWGAQFEAGAFATSYIPTTSATATRAADWLYISGLAAQLTPGFTAMASVNGRVEGSFPSVMSMTTGATTPALNVFSTANATLYLGHTGFADRTLGTITATQKKVALGIGATALRAGVNGILGASQADATAAGLDRLHVGVGTAGGTPANGYIEKIVIFPGTVISDAQKELLSQIPASGLTVPAELTSLTAALALMERAGRYGVEAAALAAAFARSGLELSFTDSTYRKGLASTSSFLALGGSSYSRAGTAYALTAAGALVSFGANVPRITDRGCLIEESRTNLLLRSQEFDNASWGKFNITVTVDAAAAPDGTMTADKLEATASAATSLNQFVTAAGSASNNTVSVFLKKGSGATDANNILLRNDTTATNLVGISINYDTGAIVSYTAGASGAVVTALANGWWRITLTPASGVSAGDTLRVYVGFTGNSETAGEFCYAWGAQLEAGGFPTSYIPTTSATATRAADVLAIAGLGFTIDYTAHAAWTEAIAASARVIDISNNAIIRKSSGSVVANFGGGPQPSVVSAGTAGKAAVAFRSNGDVQLRFTGGLTSTATGGTAQTSTTLNLGSTGSSSFLNGYLQSVVLIPKAANDAQQTLMVA